MKPATQNEKVLRHLRGGQPLTGLEALRLYGIMRLAARIKDLRDQGHAIDERKARGQRYSTYRMVQPKATDSLFDLPGRGRPE